MTKTEAVWIQNLKAFITTGLFRDDERWKKIFIEQLDRINEATTPASVSSEPTQEFTLRAMAHNYSGGHSWDHLDGEACLKAADEIRGLRVYLSALAPQAGDNVEEPVAVLDDLHSAMCLLETLSEAMPTDDVSAVMMSVMANNIRQKHFVGRDALASHPCTSTPAPDLEDKGGDGEP
jgi:hypothetical protein